MRIWRVLLVMLLLVVIGLIVVWAARRPLSEAVVARWFAGQQVDARYTVTALSPSSVTLENVALGPAARPEFTAERIVAQVGWSPLRPRVDTVTLLRPQLRAAIVGGRLSLGSLDRLIPKSDTPQPLPDIDVRVIEGRIAVATPLGVIGARVDGAGRLANGFDGIARVDPVRASAQGCTLAATGTTIRLITASDRIDVAASGRTPRLACDAGVAATDVAWRVLVALPPTLDRYRGQFDVEAARLNGPGVKTGAARLTGTVAAPAIDAALGGTFEAGVVAIAGRAAARTVSGNGTYDFNPSSGVANLDARLAVEGGRVRLPLAALETATRASPGTLVAPLLTALAARMASAARDSDGSVSTSIRRDAGGVGATFRDLEVRSASGTRLRQSGRIEARARGLTQTGQLSLSGGGLPAISIAGGGSFARGAATGRWTIAMPRWGVPGAVVEAPRLAVVADANGFLVEGPVRVAGALGGGIVATGLAVPLTARFDGDTFKVGTRCTTLGWTMLTRDALRVDPASLRVCPVGDAVLTLRNGRIGGAATFDQTPLAVRYGARGGTGLVSGRVDTATLAASGRVAGAHYIDAGAPVAIARGDAAWRFARGILTVSQGRARVTDRAAPARFEPLAMTGIAATLVDGRVTATGTGTLASNAAQLFIFTARHDLATATGSADATANLVFSSALQPDEITANLRGIVANVRGPVYGTGRFDWVGDRLTSRGTARLDKLNLATAALGPVDGIDGSIAFDDLLALTTPPGQTLRIARINPGVAVDDGVAVFRMLGPGAAEIASLAWPYAGGTLTLAPVTIRAGDLRREFRLTVDNLDAEAFLQLFEIKNLNVTGRFDGVLPLVFADNKGRIVGGRLVARSGGGLVQYVGEVGSEQLGAGARLAFDALRKLRYRDLALELDGDLDGELVTQLRFAGTNEAQATLGGGPVPIRATGLPFQFNVTVRAPFRALLGTAASFSDVRPLIRGEAVPPLNSDVQVQPR